MAHTRQVVKKDVRARKTITHEVVPAVPERYINVTQSVSEVFACLFDNFRCRAVNVGEALVRPVPPHNVQARGIELGRDEEAPFEPSRKFRRIIRN